MDGGPKENANPTIVAVESSRSIRRKALQYRDIRAISCNGESSHLEETHFFPNAAAAGDSAPQEEVRSLHDWAVIQALSDAAAASPLGLSLLRHVGITMADAPTLQSMKKSRQMFQPAESDTPQQPSEPVSTSGSDLPEDEALDEEEVFDIIRNIQDPEHPLTLEQLGVVSRGQIQVHDPPASLDGAEDVAPHRPGTGSIPPDGGAGNNPTLDVRFTPTIPHCSMATLIGLCIRVKLLRSIPPRFKVTVRIEPGTHQSEQSVNKQLADKERVCAALENKHLLGVVNRCIANGMNQGSHY